MNILKVEGRFNLKKLAASLLLALGAGFLGGLFSMSARTVYASLNLPAFSPPMWLFAPVWIVLYLLMALAFYRILLYGKDAEGAKSARSAYYTQLIFNVLWSLLFFGFSLRVAAFVDSLILLFYSILCIIRFRKLDKPAALLMLPNAIWVLYAAILNLAIVILNH